MVELDRGRARRPALLGLDGSDHRSHDEQPARCRAPAGRRVGAHAPRRERACPFGFFDRTHNSSAGFCSASCRSNLAIAAYVRWRNARAQAKVDLATDSPIRTWTNYPVKTA
ncbi:hypothetical protein GCM10009608_76880 [Pseudonocardia alaniniphila]